MNEKFHAIEKLGDGLVDVFHYFALFGIGSTIVWQAQPEMLKPMCEPIADVGWVRRATAKGSHFPQGLPRAVTHRFAVARLHGGLRRARPSRRFAAPAWARLTHPTNPAGTKNR
jgi:hypothetical protein